MTEQTCCVGNAVAPDRPRAPRAKPLPADTDVRLDLDPETPPSTWLQALISSDRVTA